MPNHKDKTGYKGRRRSQDIDSEWPSIVPHDSVLDVASKTAVSVRSEESSLPTTTTSTMTINLRSRNEKLNTLLEIFPEVDKDIISDILEQCGDDVPKATDKLIEILEEDRHRKKGEETDLAVIACSLLSDEATSSVQELNIISDPTERLHGELDQMRGKEINSYFSLVPAQSLVNEGGESFIPCVSVSPFHSRLLDNENVALSNNSWDCNHVSFMKHSQVQPSSGAPVTGQSHVTNNSNRPVEPSFSISGDKSQKSYFENNSSELTESFRSSKFVSTNKYSIGGEKNISLNDCNFNVSVPKPQHLESFFTKSDTMSKGNLQDYLFSTNCNVDENFTDLKKSVDGLRDSSKKIATKKPSDLINGWDEFYEQLDLDPVEIDFVPQNVMHTNVEDLMRRSRDSSLLSNSSSGPAVTSKTAQKKRSRRSKKKHNAQGMEVNNLSKENSHPMNTNSEEIEDNLLYPKETLNIEEAVSLIQNNEMYEISTKIRNVAECQPGGANIVNVEMDPPTKGGANISSSKNKETKNHLSPNAPEFLPQPLVAYQQPPVTHCHQQPPVAHQQPLVAQLPVPVVGSPKKKSAKSKKRAPSSTLNKQKSVTTEANGHVQDKPQEEMEYYDDPADPLGWNAILSPRTLGGKTLTKKISEKKNDTLSMRHQPQQRQKPPWAVGIDFSDAATKSREDHSKKFGSASKKARSQSIISSSSSSSGEWKEDHSHHKLQSSQMAIDAQPHSDSMFGEPGRIVKGSPLSNQSVSFPMPSWLPSSLLSKAHPLSSIGNPKNVSADSLIKGPVFCSGRTSKDLQTTTKTETLNSLPNKTVAFKNKLAFRSVMTPMDIIRMYILEKQPVLVILRGLPGSGKSYLAKQLIAEGQKMGTDGVILSTDDYFMQQGSYKYNRNDLGTAHDWNKQRALNYVKQSKSPIIIDNTNTTLWEFLPYAQVAVKHKYDVQVFEPNTPWSFKPRELTRRNCHGVTKEAIVRMKERYEKISTDDLLKAASSSTRVTQSPSAAETTVEQSESYANQAQASAPPLIPSLLQMSFGLPSNPPLMQHQWNLPPHHQHQSTQRYPLFLSQPAVQQQQQLSPLLHPLFPQQSGPQQPASSWQHQLHMQQTGTPQQASPWQHQLHQQQTGPQQQLASVKHQSLAQKPAPQKSRTISHVRPVLCQNPTNQPPADSLGVSDGEEPLVLSEEQSSSSPTSVPDVFGLSDWFEAKEQRVMKNKKKFRGSSTEENNSSGITVEYLSQSLEKVLINLSEDSKDTSFSAVEQEVSSPIALEATDPLSYLGETLMASAEHQKKNAAADEDVPSRCVKIIYQEDNSCILRKEDIREDLGEPCGLREAFNESNVFDEAEKGSRLNCSCSTVESFKSCCSDKEAILSRYGGEGSEFDHHEPLSWEVNPRGYGREGLDVEAANSYLQREESQDIYTPVTVVDTEEFRYNKNLDVGSPSASESLDQGFDESPVKMSESSLSILDQYFNSTPPLAGVGYEEIDSAGQENLYTSRNAVITTSLVNYSDSDDSEDRCLDSERKKYQGHPSAGNQDEVLGTDNDMTVMEDGDVCLTESSGPTSKEGSPRLDGNENSDSSLTKRARKKRVKKGRNPGPFIDDSLKVKSKTESWSSFYKQHTEGIQTSPGEVTNSEPPSPSAEFKSTSSQCDSYYFSLLHKVNSSAFNKLQPIDLSLSDIRVISSTWSEGGESSPADPQGCLVSRKSGTNDISTNTDEAVEKEEVDLETLQNCFPEYSRKQLEYTMAICHNNLEWVCSHLLDSPALIDIEEEEEDKSPTHLRKESSVSKLKSLAELCSSVARQTNQVDQDDLEMQIIEAGETRLQKIETFGWSRIHSYERGRFSDAGFDYFSLEDFRGSSSSELTWEVLPKQMAPQYKTKPPNNVSGSSSCDLPVNRKGHLSASPGDGQISYTHVPSTMTPSPRSLAEPEMTLVNKHDSGETTSATSINPPVMPRELIKCLELLYGPLNLSVGEEGFPLDDVTARKIYNCLKLQSTKKVINTSSDHQLQNDEALARALQEEENSRQHNKSSHLPLGSEKKKVAGWTNQMPAWMYHGGLTSGLQGHSGSASPLVMAGNTSKKLKGKKHKPFNLQKRLSAGGIKSVWAGVKRRGQADSLQSIMEEELAREESQKEQMRLFELTGDTQALATRIKRNKLAELFPSLSPEFLEDIFMNAGYSMEDTVKILADLYNISPAPMSRERQEEIMEEAKQRSREEYYSQYIFPEDVYEPYDEDASPMTYEELRNEAQFYRGLARECQEKAARYQAEGMSGAALFYRQKVKDYKSYESDSNQRAAEVLFEKGKERLTKENTLDLHFYHLDEAVSAVNFAIALKEEESRLRPDKKNTYLNIVTGRGRNSKDGVPILKPAIMNHLRERCLRFEEKSPGMLKVYFGQRI